MTRNRRSERWTDPSDIALQLLTHFSNDCVRGRPCIAARWCGQSLSGLPPSPDRSEFGPARRRRRRRFPFPRSGCRRQNRDALFRHSTVQAGIAPGCQTNGAEGERRDRRPHPGERPDLARMRDRIRQCSVCVESRTRYFERPGQDKSEGKANRNQDHKDLLDPRWRQQRWAESCDDPDQTRPTTP